tara:strand:+ start:1331 stop:2401 length:1071 start_codon:yes stop_codon:yes gene_type:complete
MRVCIIGAGISSLTLAKSLVNQNIFVDIINQKKSKSQNLSRTIGISESNVEFFNKEIINIQKILWKLKKIEIFTENLKEELLLNFENKNKEAFSIVKNSNLYGLLYENLLKNKYFKEIGYKKNFAISKNYDLIINTVFSNEITRKYFSKKIEKKYNSFAFTTLIRHEKITNDIATQIFTSRGPIAFLPISKSETSVVYSINKPKSYEDLNKLIKKYNIKYKINKIGKIESFELKSVNLRKYYYKNILAFGDLLHKIHPLAGQGFNMTIRDIKILCNIIKKKINLGLPIDSSVNIEFEKKTKHKNLIFSNGIDLVYEFFNFERKSKSKVLSRSVQILGKNRHLNSVFTKIADKGFIF